jgi:hypothetical protein
MANNSEILETVPFQSAEVKIYSVTEDRIFTYTIEKQTSKTAKETTPEIGDQEAITSFPNTISSTYFLRTGRKTRTPELPDWKEEPPRDRKGQKAWRHIYLPTSRLYLNLTPVQAVETAMGPAGFSLLSEDQLDQMYAESLQNLWRDYCVGIFTSIRQAQEDGLASILKAVLAEKKQAPRDSGEVNQKVAYDRVSTFLKRQGSPGILGSLKDFENRYSQDPQLRSVVSDINEIEKKIAEVAAPRDNLRSLIQDMFTGNKELLFGDRSIDVITRKKERIGLNSLSSGEKHLLRILIETLFVEESSIVIDEPEISMHVDWQRALIQIMLQLNPRAQIILATHSPEIMTDLSDDKIFRL